MITIHSLVSVWGDTSIPNCFHKHKKSLVKNSCRVCWGMPYGLGYGLGYGLEYGLRYGLGYGIGYGLGYGIGYGLG